MIQVKLIEIKNEGKFKINKKGVTWEKNRVEGKYAYCTSENSGRTTSYKLSKEVWPVDICGYV